MKGKLLYTLASILEPIFRNLVYVVPKPSLVAGLKRRGGFGFVPRAMIREHLFLKSLDYKGKTVYDIGGHMGLMTMFFAREAGENGRVVTFEPNPQNCDVILDHIKLNGFTNVTVIPIGLGSKREKLKFVVTDSALGTASPARQKILLEQKGAQVFEAEVDAMDNQMTANNLPRPDFVKIDVEGLELDVLQGMSQIIGRHRPHMSIELHGVNELEIAKFLLSHHYKIYQVEDSIDITEQNLDRVHAHLYVHS
jgi:FkbM family methyltransferase